MPKTRAGIDISQQELDAKKWGNSGTGQARLNPQGEIEVYGESDAGTPPPQIPTAPAAPAAPGPTPQGAASPMASLQAAADPGAGWAQSAAQSQLRPGLGARSFTPMQKLFSGLAY